MNAESVRSNKRFGVHVLKQRGLIAGAEQSKGHQGREFVTVIQVLCMPEWNNDPSFLPICRLEPVEAVCLCPAFDVIADSAMDLAEDPFL